MFSIRSLRIRSQILLITLPPVFMLLCAVGLIFGSYWSASRSARLMAKSLEGIGEAQSLLQHLTEVFIRVCGYASTRQPAQLDAFANSGAEAARDLARLRKLEDDNPSHSMEVEAIAWEFNRMQTDWVNPTMDRVKRGGAVDPAATMQDGQARLTSIVSKVVKLLNEEQAENLAERREADLLVSRMLKLGVTAGVLLAGVLLLVTRAVTRLISQPVRQLIEASEQVSRGDYQPSLPPAVDNEFGVLSQSFAHMTAALWREREEIAALNKFSEAVTQCTSEHEVYDHLLHSLRERFGPQQVIIFRLNAAENFLEAAASQIELSPAVRSWPVIEEPHNCKAVRSGRPFHVQDVSLEPQCPSRFALPKQGNYYCAPLIAGGIIIGAVRLEGVKDSWTPEHERLLESYLSGAASALSNLRLLGTMKQQATIDMLTGLYNRRFLEDYARKVLAMARRRLQPVGVIMMDLDNFKSFNDVWGHEVGDRVLRAFAKTVVGSMRETNLAARLGGDEFVVILPDTPSKACLVVAERIRQAVMGVVVPSGTDKPLPQVTASLGVATFPEHGQTFEEVLLAADKALYESKRAGNNRSTLYASVEEPKR